MAAGGDEAPGAAGGGGKGGVLAATSGRSVDKALEEAAASGSLNLTGRKLKEFPRSARNYDLSDITHADLSKNRLCELPEELCQFISLETVILYHNGMRSLSPNLSHLQALTYLNLSRNLLSSLPAAVCQLPLLRVLIFSNNKLSSLPASIQSLTHLRQLDVSCNELQCLPAELGQLECLRDLNLRRNQLTALPEEIADLPLVRLDVSCNRISHVPVCYRRLRSLQSMSLDNNPLLLPPAHVCSKGQYHIFKYLHLEAHRRRQEEMETHLRPTAFNSCLSDQELLFSVQFGGLDSGFNSVDSGNKRWSGNESADDFSERSLRLAEGSRDNHRNLEEKVEEDPSPSEGAKVNGDSEQVEFIDSVTEEEDEESPPSAPLTAPPAVSPAALAEQKKMRSSPSHSSDSSTHRSSLHVELGPPQSSSSSPSPASTPCVSHSPPSPAPPSPSLEERRRPGSLLLWQERERQHLLKSSSSKTGSHVTAAPQAGSCSAGGSPENTHSSHNGLRHRRMSADQMSPVVPAAPVQRSASRIDMPSSPQTSSPPGQAQKPNSFLFRTSSRNSFKSAGSGHSLLESGRSESRTTLRSPKEDRPDVIQLRKTLECRLKVSLPEDLGEALSNGTVLCQLVNQIRPRSVQIIHIPSPAVPKLSSAKCRLNVENFISACRRLGVTETEVCACSDVFLCKTSAVQRCVSALLEAVSAAPKRLEEEEEEEGEETSSPLRRGASQHSSPSPSSSSSSSSSSSPLLSTDFLLVYVAAMTLLYVLYCYTLG